MARTMKAMVVTALGGPEVMAARKIPLIWPRGGRDCLVRLKAASLNPADTWFRRLGGYVQASQPLVLGHDGAGIVEEIGAGVTQLRPGDRVCFCNGGIGGETGTYAEFSVVPEWQLAKIPRSVDFIHAAALPLVAITIWEALVDRARLKTGEAVLIHAGAGGTGHIGIQIAKARGARVATTISSPAKAKLVTELGADCAIHYRKQDFVVAGKAWSKGGFQVALDNVGAEIMQRTCAAMAPYGRVVTLIGTPGDDGESTAYNSNLTIHNVMMLTPMWRELAGRLRQQAERVRRALDMTAKGKIRVVVDRTFPLVRAGAAHAYLEGGKAVGKIVLEI
jgi:NADPH2:quinone reductase